MKLFFIVGEPSADLHASNLIKALMNLKGDIEIAYTGGPLMESVLKHPPVTPISRMSFMGFAEVLKNIRTIQKNFRKIKEAILLQKPDALILVDYPGFNLRMAKWASLKHIPVYYYISPTVWAWKEKRVETIREFVKKLYVILPFEKPFYAKHGIDVGYFGHPLLDAIDEKKTQMVSREVFLNKNGLEDKPIIAVLPGSRKQEIERMLSSMLEIYPHYTNYQFVIAGSTNIPESYYRSFNLKITKVIFGQTYELMNYAVAGIIKSGTSTLESALFRLPQVVCYRTGNISYAIAKKIVNVNYISLVNLILDKPAVKELIQSDFNPSAIRKELDLILFDKTHREQILKDYDTLIQKLEGSGASQRVAEDLLFQLSTKIS